MDQMQRDFKGVWISKDVWLDERITALEKIILMEIDSLDVGEEGCYASNEYLAKFCNCSSTKVSNAVSKLIELGYVEVIKFDGKKRFLRSRLTKSVRQTYKKCKADLQKVSDINIINNIDNNIYNIYTSVVDYLNLKTNSKFKSTTNKTKTLIKARIREGFTEQDFKTVIDNKTKEWLGTNMEKYLRPETLFGTKFESYLNQKTTKPKWFEQKIEKEEVQDLELQEMFKEFK